MVTELDRAWAETQIEAMADDSLSADARKRMLAAIERHPDLATQVDRARSLRRELGRLADVPVPRGLFWRLWRIPGSDRSLKSAVWLPAGALATIAVVALGINLFFSAPEQALDEAAREAAIQDFTVVMAYLQKSAVVAQNEVNEAVGSGVLDALAVSRGMLDRPETDVSEGD